MKKLIICLLCMFAAFGADAFAATIECDYNKDNYKLTVSGDAGTTNAHLRVSCMIMNGNEALPESSESENENVIATMTCTADRNGKYIFTPVTVSSGDCTVYVSVYGGENAESKALSLPTTANTTYFVDQINMQTTANGILTLLEREEQLPTFYADLRYYSALRNENAKLKIADFILKCRNEGRYEIDNSERASNLDDDIILASLLVYASENKDATLVGEILNVEESGLEARYKNVILERFDLDSFRTTPSGEYTINPSQRLLTMIANVAFADIDQFEDAVITGVVNYKLSNGTPWADVDGILYAHDSELEECGLDYQKLDRKKSSQKAMSAILEEVPFAGIEDLVDTINDILDTNYSQGGGSNTNSNYNSVGVAQGKTEEDKPLVDSIFADVSKNHWAYNAVEYLAYQGIVSGTGNNCFEPDRSVKREEFVQMIVKAFKLINEGDTCSFSDVQDNAWYEPAIASATTKGIVSGFSSEYFGVGQDISRQDMAVMAYNTLKFLKPETQEAQFSSDSFTDSESIADYAKNAVGCMYENGIIKGMGDGRFAGQETATRAQAAIIIFGLINSLR